MQKFNSKIKEAKCWSCDYKICPLTIKHRKIAFYCFLSHFLYIIKQMEKPKPCITMWQNTSDIWEHSRNVENTRFYISFVFSNARRVLSQCNTRLGLLYLLSDFRNGLLFTVWWLISAHGPSIRVCLVFLFPLSQIPLYRSLQTLVIMPHRCWKMMELLNKIFFSLL